MSQKCWMVGVAATSALLISGIATAQQPQPMPRTAPADNLSSLSAGDRQFVTEAVRGSEREVELGDLAEEKAQNLSVREFGARMVQDHTRAALAAKTLPTLEDHLRTVKALQGSVVGSGR